MIDWSQNRRPLARTAGLLFLLLLLKPVAWCGEIVLTPAGGGRWQMTAQGLVGVAGLDIDLRYDAASLPNLTVENGPLLQGVLLAVNDQTRGVLRVGAVATLPLPSQGILLTLTAPPPSELKVAAFSVKALDVAGRPLQTQVRWNSPVQPSVNVTAEEKITASASPVYQTVTALNGTTPGAAANGGRPPVTRPTPQSAATDPLMPEAQTASLSATHLPSMPAPPDKRYYSQASVLAGIRSLSQPWTLARVEQVFRACAATAKVRQEPLVAVADGQATLHLWLEKGVSRSKPALAVEGCRLVGIVDDDSRGWRVELATYRGVWPAQLLLLGEKELLRLALVVVPRLQLPPGVAKLMPIEPLPAIDLNDDGVSDAVDAYLLVGNWLAAQSE